MPEAGFVGRHVELAKLAAAADRPGATILRFAGKSFRKPREIVGALLED